MLFVYIADDGQLRSYANVIWLFVAVDIAVNAEYIFFSIQINFLPLWMNEIDNLAEVDWIDIERTHFSCLHWCRSTAALVQPKNNQMSLAWLRRSKSNMATKRFMA